MSSRLIPLSAVPKWDGTRALAIRRSCPHCTGDLQRTTSIQPPLLRGAGYGEALAIELVSCRCTSRVASMQAINPRGLT